MRTVPVPKGQENKGRARPDRHNNPEHASAYGTKVRP